MDIPRSDIGRDDGGEVSLGDVGVRGRNPFNAVRGADVDMILVRIESTTMTTTIEGKVREERVSRDSYILINFLATEAAL